MQTDFNIFRDKHLYRISEIADQTGIPRDNVYRQLKQMKIPYTKLNPEGRTQFYLGSHINKVLRLNRSEDWQIFFLIRLFFPINQKYIYVVYIQFIGESYITLVFFNLN